jgi:hypothetical protein
VPFSPAAAFKQIHAQREPYGPSQPRGTTKLKLDAGALHTHGTTHASILRAIVARGRMASHRSHVAESKRSNLRR